MRDDHLSIVRDLPYVRIIYMQKVPLSNRMLTCKNRYHETRKNLNG